MDGPRFDALSRSLACGHSRRALTRVLSGLTFGGTLARFGLTESGAKGKHHQRRAHTQGKKPCPACKKRKKGKCKGVLPDGTACAGGTCQGGACLPTVSPPPSPVSPPPSPPPVSPPPPPGPTCSDGIQNGNESDVDCGGSCSRCLDGKTCTSRNDCASALCDGGTCRGCFSHAECASDALGACTCFAVSVLPGRCVQSVEVPVDDCAQCTADSSCFTRNGVLVSCQYPCGATACPTGQRRCPQNGLCRGCCDSSECTGGKQCLLQSNGTYRCACPSPSDQLCDGVCIPAECADLCFAQCPPGVAVGQPCCSGGALTCRPEAPGSPEGSCQP